MTIIASSEKSNFLLQPQASYVWLTSNVAGEVCLFWRRVCVLSRHSIRDVGPAIFPNTLLAQKLPASVLGAIDTGTNV